MTVCQLSFPLQRVRLCVCWRFPFLSQAIKYMQALFLLAYAHLDVQVPFSGCLCVLWIPIA
jgi:hypothetical protein